MGKKPDAEGDKVTCAMFHSLKNCYAPKHCSLLPLFSCKGAQISSFLHSHLRPESLKSLCLPISHSSHNSLRFSQSVIRESHREGTDSSWPFRIQMIKMFLKYEASDVAAGGT